MVEKNRRKPRTSKDIAIPFVALPLRRTTPTPPELDIAQAKASGERQGTINANKEELQEKLGQVIDPLVAGILLKARADFNDMKFEPELDKGRSAIRKVALSTPFYYPYLGPITGFGEPETEITRRSLETEHIAYIDVQTHRPKKRFRRTQEEWVEAKAVRYAVNRPEWGMAPLFAMYIELKDEVATSVSLVSKMHFSSKTRSNSLDGSRERRYNSRAEWIDFVSPYRELIKLQQQYGFDIYSSSMDEGFFPTQITVDLEDRPKLRLGNTRTSWGSGVEFTFDVVDNVFRFNSGSKGGELWREYSPKEINIDEVARILKSVRDFIPANYAEAS